MNDDVIEGEVIEPGIEEEIRLETGQFHRRMDELMDAYLFTADAISRGAFRPKETQPVPQEPGVIHMTLRATGKVFLAVGDWLLEKYKAPGTAQASEKPEGAGAWPGTVNAHPPTRLPRPDFKKRNETNG